MKTTLQPCGSVVRIPADSTQPVITLPMVGDLCGERNDHRTKWFAAAKDYVAGYIEIVWVLHTGRRTLMLVNEMGAMIGLPPNERATHIYHAASKARGSSLLYAPLIYGNAMLFENVEVD